VIVVYQLLRRIVVRVRSIRIGARPSLGGRRRGFEDEGIRRGHTKVRRRFPDKTPIRSLLSDHYVIMILMRESGGEGIQTHSRTARGLLLVPAQLIGVLVA